jgi:hypothetical protein
VRIGSQDDVEEEKLSSCSIRAHNKLLAAAALFFLAVAVAVA